MSAPALTALAMKGDAKRLVAEGFDSHFAKPVCYKDLLAAVAEMLRVRQA